MTVGTLSGLLTDTVLVKAKLAAEAEDWTGLLIFFVACTRRAEARAGARTGARVGAGTGTGAGAAGRSTYRVPEAADPSTDPLAEL